MRNTHRIRHLIRQLNERDLSAQLVFVDTMESGVELRHPDGTVLAEHPELQHGRSYRELRANSHALVEAAAEAVSQAMSGRTGGVQ